MRVDIDTLKNVNRGTGTDAESVEVLNSDFSYAKKALRAVDVNDNERGMGEIGMKQIGMKTNNWNIEQKKE